MKSSSRPDPAMVNSLSEAMRVRLAGRAQEALQRLNAIVAADPGNRTANMALADILLQAGDREAALAALRRAAESAPGDAVVWGRYVHELRDAGQKARARKAARQARVSAEAGKRLRDIAEGRSAPVDDIVNLIQQGRAAEAWTVGLKRVERFPQDDRLLNLLGVAALSDEDPVQAEDVLRRAVEIAPTSQAALSNLGLALVRQGRAHEAVRLLEPAMEQAGAAANLRVNLAGAYLRAERFEDAERLAAQAMDEMPDDPEILGIRAKALIRLGRAGEALELIEARQTGADLGLQDVTAEALVDSRGKEAAIEYIDGLVDLGRQTAGRLSALLAELGELDRAAQRARALAEEDPSDPAPFRLLGLCARWTENDPLIARMQAATASDLLPIPKRGTFGLALAKAYMDIGDDARAFEALKAGNDLNRRLVQYDVAEDEAMMDEIARHWTADAIAAAQVPEEGPSPVFIVGLPRSGSTLIETILSRHPAVEALGETPRVFIAASRARLKPQASIIESVRSEVIELLTPLPPKRVKTDKLLANFLHLGVLATAFPKARFVEMKRDYRDVCLSIYQADLGARSHPYSMSLNELARYAVSYHRLMEHWADVLKDRLVRVTYEDIVSDPETALPRLVQSVGLEWDVACLAPTSTRRRISTMSVAQARKPISMSSVGRWKRFAAQLTPMTRILEDHGLVQGS